METPTTPPPLDAPLPEKLDFRTLFEALLRRPYELVHRLAQRGHGATGRFAAIMTGSFLLFGVVIGCFYKHEQLWAAPLKITAGLAIAALICFPSLYIFSTLAGGRLSIQQLAAGFAGALALAGLLLLGFAPAVWIFSESTDSYGFVGALGIGAWLVALLFGLRFLKTAVFAAGANRSGPLILWGGVFALVTLQMTTSLRPILGHSDKLLTQEKKFFLAHWGDWIGESQKTTTQTTPVLRSAEATPNQNPTPDPEAHRNPHVDN
ncbi:hypothetical protein [Luteolibacter sp. LG18]|uniref:hypothetical protein n=1 Tax=Luteolibacter sp. LG18 TaxID=2819286 RepID=UPI002B2A20FB|nr:hypothetical protein llg_07630 [Luteolibacter sp. LG18]